MAEPNSVDPKSNDPKSIDPNRDDSKFDDSKFDDLQFDDFDRRFAGALHAVEVPADLHARLQVALQIAAHEHLLAESNGEQASRTETAYQERVRAETMPEETRRIVRGNPVPQNLPNLLLNRRSAIAAAVAAGLGGAMLGYRQLTQPLSQEWLVKSTQLLLAQLPHAKWQAFNESEAVAVKQSLLNLGFLRYVHSIAFESACELQPPHNVQHARAVNLGNEMVLLELRIDRGVQNVGSTLNELAWSRSDSAAFAMSSGNATLVFTGPTNIRRPLVRARTT